MLGLPSHLGPHPRLRGHPALALLGWTNHLALAPCQSQQTRTCPCHTSASPPACPPVPAPGAPACPISGAPPSPEPPILSQAPPNPVPGAPPPVPSPAPPPVPSPAPPHPRSRPRLILPERAEQPAVCPAGPPACGFPHSPQPQGSGPGSVQEREERGHQACVKPPPPRPGHNDPTSGLK